MPREYCNQCHFPAKTCLCAYLDRITIPVEVYIFQHPKEVNHAKNTARLAKLIDNGIHLINFRDTGLVNSTLRKIDRSRCALMFPNETSASLESTFKNNLCEQSIAPKYSSFIKAEMESLILLDGSWRQAYGMWQENRLLRGFTHFHFDDPPPQQYSFRCAKKTHHLSTIEALSYALSVICDIDTEVFGKILSARKRHWPNSSTKTN